MIVNKPTQRTTGYEQRPLFSADLTVLVFYLILETEPGLTFEKWLGRAFAGVIFWGAWFAISSVLRARTLARLRQEFTPAMEERAQRLVALVPGLEGLAVRLISVDTPSQIQCVIVRPTEVLLPGALLARMPDAQALYYVALGQQVSRRSWLLKAFHGFQSLLGAINFGLTASWLWAFVEQRKWFPGTWVLEWLVFAFLLKLIFRLLTKEERTRAKQIASEASLEPEAPPIL